MKIKKAFIFVFLLTFLAGCLLIAAATKIEVVARPAAPALNSPKMPVPSVTPETEKPLGEENIDWQGKDAAKFKIKLLETGEGFHGDQVNAESGEIWLGLFKDQEKYFLRNTALKISRVHDPIVDEQENIETGKSVSTDSKAEAIFLLKNAKTLRQGEIETVFLANDEDESSYLKNNTQKTFDFNGETYVLSVENKLSSDEFLGKGSKLTLMRSGEKQVLNYLKDECSDCFWRLHWIGDLDRDGKLDFYFDLSGHYNVSDKRLFLSSPAAKGKLVKYVANFWTNGC